MFIHWNQNAISLSKSTDWLLKWILCLSQALKEIQRGDEKIATLISEYFDIILHRVSKLE